MNQIIRLNVGDIFDHLERFTEDEMGSCLRELGKSLSANNAKGPCS
jgi:hypothetical protein